jgi:hypothetical protein
MIEKKLILCSILALAIGIATAAPVEYFMLADAQTTDLTNIQPCFTVDTSYAYCNLNVGGGNNTASWQGASIEAVANFTLTPDALSNADAQIEYYKFAVSSDQGPIVDMGYYVSIEKQGITYGASGNGTIWFTNGLTFNGPACNGGQSLMYHALNRGVTTGYISDYILAYNTNEASKTVLDLRSAQALYIDVSKVSTVTVTGDITITTPASSDIIQHIVLTKTADGFVYGDYTGGTLPLPIVPYGEAATPTPLVTFGPNNTAQP